MRTGRPINTKYFLAGLFFVLISACSSETENVLSPGKAVLEKGEVVYQKFCAECHGEQAEGAPGWRWPNAEGFYPPPALDGSGHMWHHSLPELRDTMNNGRMVSLVEGQPPVLRMPGWKDRLSAQEVDAVLAWLIARWPSEIRAEWQDVN